ncbi:MAG: cyclase dehydrase [Methylibium sp.]|uniref:hypothetical protein n=1 Tax=Methylibium sp. TaxID=2067992 RepID=UPI0017CDAFA1|nr:hypothetical protein [Methylibium sp.]MBA2722317.1 cyclase dehydrase [Methylibium sp.]MBA3597633.1 cyclase dehydrase [Methylibium sp.]
MNQLAKLNSTHRGRAALRNARGLGLFSIALGMAELLAPRAVARATGLQGHELLLRAYGLREIATGFGLLTSARPTRWLWARVGGDALDMATLGARLHDGNPHRLSTAVALASVATVTAVDSACARSVEHAAEAADAPVHDYSDRRGLADVPTQMRGAALETFEMPQDMRTPEALRPYVVH